MASVVSGSFICTVALLDSGVTGNTAVVSARTVHRIGTRHHTTYTRCFESLCFLPHVGRMLHVPSYSDVGIITDGLSLVLGSLAEKFGKATVNCVTSQIDLPSAGRTPQ
jgi:hypothetical protein